jgi:nitroreductase
MAECDAPVQPQQACTMLGLGIYWQTAFVPDATEERLNLLCYWHFTLPRR